MRILVAEDNPTNALLLTESLQSFGYEWDLAENGRLALALLETKSYDAIVTDWAMPEMDGLTFIRAVRERSVDSPPILMITAIDHPRGRALALDSGADEFMTKPIAVVEFRRVLDGLLLRAQSPVIPASMEPRVPVPVVQDYMRPEFAAICLVASTGGPTALRALLVEARVEKRAVYLVVQHGPAWLVDALATSLGDSLEVPVCVAEHGQRLVPGSVYFAPGDSHLSVSTNMTLCLDPSAPPRNYVRPSADVLFESVSEVFRDRALALVHAGVGVDGARGARAIARNGGRVLVPNPQSLSPSQMIRATLLQNPDNCAVVALPELAARLRREVAEL